MSSRPLIHPCSSQHLLGSRYALLERIGVGGMGTVYRAHDVVRGTEVAVKLVASANDTGLHAHARLHREACLGRQLEHPNLVQIYGFGVEGERSYLVMPLYSGETLRGRLNRMPAISWRRAATIGVDLASALGALHDKGYVHRDVKPSNVLLGIEDRATLIDLGIAAPLEVDSGVAQRDLTPCGEIIATVGYSAPETLSGDPCSVRSDLYALGVLLWEMIAGSRPFAAATGADIVHRQLCGAPPLRDLVPEVPPALAALIDSLLAANPARRPADARSVERQLCAIVEANRAAPPRPPATKRLHRLLQCALYPFAFGAIVGGAIGLMEVLWR